MSELIYQFIYMRRLSTGRRLFALRRVREVTENQGQNDILAVVDEALRFDTNAYERELAWRRSRELPESRGKAFEIDVQIDRVLGAIYRQLEDNANVMEGTDLAEKARTLLSQLFPSRLQPIIQQTFEEQLVNNKAILTGLKADDALVDNLGLRHYIERLDQLVPQFDNELQINKKPEVSWDALCALRDTGNVHLRRVIAAILSTGGLSETDEKTRAELMAPVIFQIERAAKARRYKSDSVDVDPDTGDEVPDPAPDTTQ